MRSIVAGERITRWIVRPPSPTFELDNVGLLVRLGVVECIVARRGGRVTMEAMRNRLGGSHHSSSRLVGDRADLAID